MLPTILKLIQTGSKQVDCQSLTAKLVISLHPWPKLWGIWDEWLAVCRLAADILARQGEVQAQGWLLADVVEMLFELGRYEDALAVFAQLEAIADGRPEMARPFCRAGHTASTKLILSGHSEKGMIIYERQVAWLSIWRFRLSEADFYYAQTLVVLQQTMVMRRQDTQHEAVAMIDTILAQLPAWLDMPLDLWRDVYHHQGGVLLSTADYVGSVAAMEQAIAFAVQMDDAYGEAGLYADKALPLWGMGAYDEVETAVRRSIYLCEKLKANWRLARSIHVLVSVLVTRGLLDEAMIWLARQMELTQQMQDEALFADAYTLRALVYMQREQYALALADLQVSMNSYRQREVERWVVWGGANMSWCYSLLGDEETAVSLAHYVLQLSRDARTENVEVLALRCLARFQTGAAKQSTLKQAVQLAQKINSLFNEAACLFDLVAADTAVQEVYWQQAVSLLERCGVMGWVNGSTVQNPPCLPLIA